MAKRRKYAPEVKAAVLAALLAGQRVSDVAEKYKMPRATVSAWKCLQNNGTSLATLTAEKKETIGELLFGYLKENLRALRVQSQVFQDKDWLKSQGAAELGTLHGIQTDKAVRLLEALDGGDEIHQDLHPPHTHPSPG